MGLLQLLAILWARRIVVLGCFLSTVILAVGITLILPKSYEARVTILTDNEARNAYTNDFESRNGMADFLGKQVAIVKSERTAHQVIKDLHLAENTRFRREYLRSHNRKVTMDDWIAARLIKSLQVYPMITESSIQIAYRSPDADTAATVANAFADAYMRTDNEIKVGTAQQTATRLKDQSRQLQRELAEAEKNLREYMGRTGFVVAPGDLDSETKQLESLQQLLRDTTTATESAKAQLNAYRQAKAAGATTEDLEGVINNELINDLRGQIAQLNADLAQVRGRYGTGHPDYTSGMAKKAALQAEVNKELNRIESSLSAAIVAGQQKLADLDKAIADQKDRVVNLQSHWGEYSNLANEVKTKRAELEQALARSGQEMIESRVSTMTALILSPAAPPPNPNFPNLWLNAGLAVAFGGFFGLVMAVLVELFDRRIRSADDFEDAAGAPVIVVMPKRA